MLLLISDTCKSLYNLHFILYRFDRNEIVFLMKREAGRMNKVCTDSAPCINLSLLPLLSFCHFTCFCHFITLAVFIALSLFTYFFRRTAGHQPFRRRSQKRLRRVLKPLSSTAKYQGYTELNIILPTIKYLCNE